VTRTDHALRLGAKLVNDPDCTAFLQWALPQLDLRWPGFRKVRRQVCKRLKRRMSELELDGFAAYRARLASDPSEWRVLDECCHITISRFFRDRRVFDVLRTRVLPEIAARAARAARPAHIWSAGCAAGEEAYTLEILWDLEVATAFAGVRLAIVATDIDQTMLARAREGCFEATSLRELPPHLARAAFEPVGSRFCVKARHRDAIEFLHQDLRVEMPAGMFDLVLCRYVAFTYFALPLQQRVLTDILDRLSPGGYLVIGTHERLPDESAVSPVAGCPQIFEKRRASQP